MPSVLKMIHSSLKEGKIRPLFQEMKEEMQKELHGDVTRGRKNVRDARKAAMQRVKIATDTTLRKIEAMAEEAVAQAMRESANWCCSFGPESRSVKFVCSVWRERIANVLGAASIRPRGCV